MTKIEYHKKVFDLIKGSPNPLIDASFIEIDNNPFAIQLAQELSIEVERIQNKLRLLTSTIKTKIYESIDIFLTVKEISENSDFLIIDNENIFSFFDNTTFINFEQKENYLITNHKAFLEFLSILKRYESETDDTFHFVDTFNKDLHYYPTNLQT